MAGSCREVQVHSSHQNVRNIKINNSSSSLTSVSLTTEETIISSIGGGYTYRGSSNSNRALRNRCITWKLSQNTLELTETSLDIELYGNNLRVVVSEGTILPNVLVHESVSSVSILIATTNSVHRLVFPHPSKGRQDFYLPSGINASLASIFNTPPSGTNQSNWSSASFPQHCNGVSAFLGADDRCYFSLTTETGALLLVILPSMNSDKSPEVHELRHASMMQRLWTGLVPTVFRGDNALSDGTQCSVVHSIGNSTMIFALCRDLKFRIWSAESLECIEITDLVPLIPDDLDTQQGVAQAFVLKKAVDEKEGRLFLAAYLNFTSQSQFCIFEIFDSDQGIEIAHVSSCFRGLTSLVDFTLTPKFIWAMWTLSDGETAVEYSPIEGGLDKDIGWHPVHSQPLETSEVYIPIFREPREVYLDHLFYPGRFSKGVITKAMQMLMKTADCDVGFIPSANSTLHEIKEQIIKLMDSEVQRTALDYEVGQTEYHNLQLQCWSKFYSSVVQYSQGERKPIGLFADHVSGLVSVVRQEYQGYVYSCDWLEHLYLSDMNGINSLEDFILDAAELQEEETAKDIMTIMDCIKSVSLQFPETIIFGIEVALESNEDIMPLLDDLVDAITTNSSDNEELIADSKSRADYMRDLESSFQLLVHHMSSLSSICDAMDPEKWLPEELEKIGQDTAGSGLQYFDKKQLFCSPQAKSVICETIIKKAECYVEICRDLLITLKVMGRLGGRIGLDLNSSDIINTEYVARVHRLLRAYFTIVWLGRQPVIPVNAGSIESSLRKLATLELTEVAPLTKAHGEGINSSSSFLQFFVSSVGVPHAIDLINSTLSATPTELKKKSSEIWTTDFKLMVDFIIRSLWPLKDGTHLPEFLLSQSQFTALQSYLHLCKGWCKENKGSREFLLGEAYLGNGQFQKALECFVKAAGSIGYKEDLLTRLVPSDAGDKQDMIVQYFIKVMRLFVQSECPELVVVVAAAALAVAKKTDLNVPMLWSNVFKYNLELGRNKEAYAAITQNPDSSRRRDCLHHFIVTLCERGELQEICEFPYAKLEDEVVSIIETRARTVDITMNKYYDLLYAFHIFKGDYRRAATSMYEYGCRLCTEMHGLASLQKQAKCYLSAINCLHLVDSKYAWIVRPREKELNTNTEEVGEKVNQSPKRKEDGEEIWPSFIPKRKSTKKTVIVELSDLEKEYSLLVARLNLIQRGKETSAVVGPGMSGVETVALLTQAGLFDSALSVATTFKIPLEPIFEGLATKCVRLTYDVARGEVPENAWDWLTANDLGNTQSVTDVSTAEQSWRLLKTYLEKFSLKNGSIYYKPVASRLLSLGSPLPTWFINKYKEANPSELLKLYVNHNLLLEASELALEYVDAVLGVGKEYFGLKTALHATTPSVWLPYSAIDQLLLALKDNYDTLELREQYDHLSKKLEVYFNKVQVVSKDMVEMHYRKEVALQSAMRR